MAKKFDPYDKWFKIPPGEQPPDHYRLLGIDRFESDTAVINEAAEQRVAFLHDVATGPQVAMTQRLLNEVAAARLCLTDPEKKSAYDARLRQPPAPKRPPKRAEKAIPVATVPGPSTPPKAIPQATPISPPPVKGQDEFAVVTDGQTGQTSGNDATSQHAAKTAKKKTPIWLAAGGAIALVLVLVIVVIAASSKDDSPAKSGGTEDGQRPLASRNIRSGAKQGAKDERQADRSPTDLADAIKQHNSTQSQRRQTPSALPTGSFDGAGGSSGWSFGSGGLSDSRVSTKGLVLWLDAGEAGTVSSLTSVRRWMDKSGRGNDAVSSPKVQSPTHRDGLINGKPGLEFQPGQRLTVEHKPPLNLGANYTIAFVAGGTGPLFAKGNAFSDKPTSGFALQPNLSQLRFSNKHACPAQNDNPSELRVRIAVANQKSVSWFIGGKPAGEYEGPHEIKNNAALQIGRFNPENPRNGFKGKLAELLIYNRPIGDDERKKIEEYLSGKWLR